MSSNKDKIVLSLGGSLVVPEGGINVDFLSDFNTFVRQSIKNNPDRQYFIVVGGGTIARHYRDAGEKVVGHELTPEDLDWLGIHATRLNAQLIRTIFRDIAHPHILKHYEIIRKVDEPVVVAAGWKPGWSTDFCATLVCDDYSVTRIINMSNIDMVYEKDPKEFPDAKPIERATWPEFRKLVGDKWVPGMNVPFDPIAAKNSQELGLTTIILNGKNLDNLQNYLDGKEFVGTVIEGE
jgi:uridylate kinase